MAHLLGSKYCIESLRNDVTDIQETVVDVFSRVGPVQLPSWKYPDKMSCDLDITELLELHDYTDDEEERQVAHVVLLELVIDRFVLLLQSMAKFADMNILKNDTEGKKSSHTSVGLATKKYWMKMLKTSKSVQSLQSETKTSKQKMSDLENQVKSYSEEIEKMRNNICATEEFAKSGKTPFPLNDGDAAIVRALTAASHYSISQDEYNKNTQTYETAFVPCESCDLVQKNLRVTGDSIIGICNSQNLPSALAKYKSQMIGIDWLTGNDVARWTAEQNKDMARINKHLLNYISVVENLNDDLKTSNKKCQNMEQKIADLKKDMNLEKETSSTQRKQYEKKICDIKQHHAEDINSMRQENDELTTAQKEAEEQIKVMKVKVEEQATLIQEIESAKETLEQKVVKNEANHEQVCQLKTQIENLNSEMISVQEKLNTTKNELNKEKAKSKSVSQHTDSLQGKQNTLLSQLDDLHQENERLQDQAAELEDQKEQLEDALEKSMEQHTKLLEKYEEEQALVKELQEEKQAAELNLAQLNKDISHLESKLQEAKEREQLIVEYPDLNGPVNPDLVGTGDLALDMENQVKANTVRIQLLEQQNLKLRSTITKMLQKQQQPAQMPAEPLPLWKTPGNQKYEDAESEINNRFVPDSGDNSALYRQEADLPRLPNRPPKTPIQKISPSKDISQPATGFVTGPSTQQGLRGGKVKSRPPSATNNGSSSIAAYAKLKKSGLMGNKNRPSSGKSSATDYQPSDSHMCPRCDKMYNNPKDLEIHQSYCYGYPR